MRVSAGSNSAVLALMLAAGLAVPAFGQAGGGSGGDSSSNMGGPGADQIQSVPTVRLSIAAVGSRCFRVVSAVAFDHHLGRPLFRLNVGSDLYGSQGVTAFENALSGARTAEEAQRALATGAADAAAYRKNPAEC